MVSIFQPRFPTQPSPAGATVATTQFPTELAPFIKDILEKSKAQQEGAAYQAYTGPQLAQFTDAERAAMEAMRQQTTGLAGTSVAQATPYFTGAKTAAEQLGEQFTGDTAQQFMNPYQQAVVDQAKRKAVEDYERNIAPAVTAQAIAQQPFGGSRQAISEAMARENLADRLTDIQERGLASAFDKGRAAFEAQKARELQQSQQLAQLGQTIPQQALRDLAVQQQLGEQERQQEQLALDLAKGQFMEEREFPTRALQEYSAIVRGFPFQPSTFQTATTYQPTPSIANQLLQLGGAGMGAYTQFTGKPLGSLFGMANQGGGIADIISNQMGMNQQMKTEEDLIRDMYYEDSKTLPIDEFYNKYGVGGENRRDIEGVIDEQFLPTETAPARIDAIMTESAVGAPPGPIPSREEVELDFFNQKMREKQGMPFNQGGLVSLPTVYRFAGNPEEENQEENNQTMIEDLPQVSDSIFTYVPPTDSTVADYDKLLTKMDTRFPQIKEVDKTIKKLTDPDAVFESEAYKRVTDPEGALVKAKEAQIERLLQMSDPDSPINIKAREDATAKRAATEGAGLVQAALSLDPNASFVQNLSQLIGGVGTAAGTARTQFDEAIAANTEKQFDALRGITETESDYLQNVANTEKNVLAGNELEIRKNLGVMSSIIDKVKASGGLTADLIQLQNAMKGKLIDFNLGRETNELRKEELKVQRADLQNKNRLTAVARNIETFIAKTDAVFKQRSTEIDQQKVDNDYKATIQQLAQDNIFDTGDGQKIQQMVGSLFDQVYVDGVLSKESVPLDGITSKAYADALNEALKIAALNKAADRDIFDGLSESVMEFKQTREYGVHPLVYNMFDKTNKTALDALKSEFKTNDFTRKEFTDKVLFELADPDDSSKGYKYDILFKDKQAVEAIRENYKNKGYFDIGGLYNAQRYNL